MKLNKLKNIFLFLILFASFEAFSNTTNVLKLYCEYDPKLIKKQTTNIDSSESNKLDTVQICKSLYCKDIVEVNKDNKPNDEAEYRLRNSWFNHQGILIDDFTMTKNIVTINTFISQAYYLESYVINRSTGKTKRIIYKFDYYELLEDKNKAEEDINKKINLYNKNGRISLKTLKLYNFKPQKKIIFEGKCMEGVGV